MATSTTMRARNQKIRRMAARGWSFAAIGRRFGISRQRVDQIVKPVRAACRRAFYDALTAGHITRPDACEDCGAEGPVDGHHEDYAAPLDVEWLCVGCHKGRHSGPTRKVARRRVLIECETCGTEFRVRPSSQDQRFCSHECRDSRKYTDDDLLGHLRHLASELGRTPTLAEVIEADGPGHMLYYRYFDSYPDACERAGLTAYGPGSPGHRSNDQEAA